MASKFQKDIEFLGKNYKTESIKLILINVGCFIASLVLFLMLKLTIYVFIPVCLALVIDIVYFYMLSEEKIKVITV